MPISKSYYKTNEGLSYSGRLAPLFKYPIEVLALCKNFTFRAGVLEGEGKAIFNIAPPTRLPELSIQEFYALWAEDVLRGVAKITAKHGHKDKHVRRYRRNLEVLSFMRATWDSLLTAHQVVRAQELVRFGVHISSLDSRDKNKINRFRSQLVYHPYDAAVRLKSAAQANRAWFFGGEKPHHGILRFDTKKNALYASFAARALPPAPPSSEGLKGLVQRLTSKPATEPPNWRTFLSQYIARWAPKMGEPELYTMPSSNAAAGYPRAAGGHITGVQHLVLIGYAAWKVETFQVSATDQAGHLMRVHEGSYLELLSQSMSDPQKGEHLLFRESWETLELTLPGVADALQIYLKRGVEWVMDSITLLPILPISAEEKGLKTRFPTATLTAANLIQQVLRRAIDHVMVQDPRFSQALGGPLDVDLRGEVGPWYSQDAHSATDLHAQWLTQTAYEEVVVRYPQLRPYVKYFDKIFGVKKLLVDLEGNASKQDVLLNPLSEYYPRAPLLDDRHIMEVKKANVASLEYGHASLILRLAKQWVEDLNDLPGVETSTGQMMGDPTSFPPLMLHTLYAAEETLREIPYTKVERKIWHSRLGKSDVVLRGVGDDAQKPRWTAERRSLYDRIFVSMGGQLSHDKCFHHTKNSIIAERVYEHGFEIPTLLLSTLVVPPGGSKGNITWNLQAQALTGDSERSRLGISKILWRMSPYYYTWRLADRFGIPISCDPEYGGVQVPLVPHRSQTDHIPWLQYMSQQKVVTLIAGMGLAIGEKALQSPLDRVARQWLEEVMVTSKEMSLYGMDLLSPEIYTSSAELRVSLKDAYRLALGRVRGAEFYFRPPVLNLTHNPSVRVAARKFQQKVRTAVRTPVKGYARTIADLDDKRTLFFARSGGFLSDPANPKPRASYGMERSAGVRPRYVAPHLRGVG
jgi:hypothetical protein